LLLELIYIIKEVKMNKKNIKKRCLYSTSDIKEALSSINAIHIYTCNNKHNIFKLVIINIKYVLTHNKYNSKYLKNIEKIKIIESFIMYT